MPGWVERGTFQCHAGKAVQTNNHHIYASIHSQTHPDTPTLNLAVAIDKPIVLKLFPPRQPLSTAVLDPAKPRLKLGLDVHLEFIMAVAQKDHAQPHAPRKFTRPQLVAQVKQWIAEGLQVCCVQE